MFEIIHQGPQDTIIFHIQNEKVGVNGKIYAMLFLSSLTQKQPNTRFLKAQHCDGLKSLPFGTLHLMVSLRRDLRSRPP